MTFASLFSGGGLADIGLMQAGLTPLWGVEISEKIGEWYRRNLGDHLILSDVGAVDYSSLPAPDLLWASPSCTRASSANNKRGEIEEDIRSGLAVARAIHFLGPRFVILENVPQYDDFKAFRIILNALDHNGYVYEHSNVCASWFGVPQTRLRLILRAARERSIPPLPDRTPARSWYEAVEDLLADLPDSEFAEWQKKLLPAELRESFMLHGQPPTNVRGKMRRDAAHPSYYVTRGSPPRAFLVDGKNSHPRSTVVREQEAPGWCVTGDHMPRAFLVRGTNAKYPAEPRREDEPAYSVMTECPPRAFVVGGQSALNGTRLTIQDGTDPFLTITASAGNQKTIRASINGRVVMLSPRCMARLQTIADGYELPQAKGLACRIIGNGVPCEMVRRLVKGLVG